MKKGEFIEALALRSGILEQDCERMLDAMFELLSEQLSQGESVHFAGFGEFSAYERRARKIKIPGTDKFVHLDASRSVRFRADERLKETLPD